MVTASGGALEMADDARVHLRRLRGRLGLNREVYYCVERYESLLREIDVFLGPSDYPRAPSRGSMTM
jgi:hypothetical protein